MDLGGCSNVLNYDQTECTATCLDTSEYPDALNICRKCTYFIPYCLNCSSTTVCDTCAAGTTKTTAGVCLEFCPAGEYLAGTGSTVCLGTCDANAEVAGNDYISSSGVICVNACEDDEYSTAGPNTCHKCASNVALANINITMEFCKKCSSEKVCTECLSGFLWTSTDTGCATSCKDRGYESYYLPQKTCVSDCVTIDISGGLHSIPLDRGDETADSIHLRCVIDCWAADK